MNKRLLFSTLVMCCVVPLSASMIADLGTLEVNDSSYAVKGRVHENGSMFKYIVTPSKDTIELKEKRNIIADSIRAKYRNLGLRLYGRLQPAPDTTQFSVIIKFPPDSAMKQLLNRPLKPSRDTIWQMQRQLYSNRKAELEKTLGIKSLDTIPEASYPNRAVIGARLKKENIQCLDNLEWISQIALFDTSIVQIKPHMSTMYGGASSGGLGMSSFSSHGSGAQVGVIDPYTIDTNRVNSDLYDVPLVIRSGSRGASSVHGVSITALIRNSTGSTATFTKGGAYDVDSIFYAKILRGGDTVRIDSIINAYNWCIDRNVDVINSSFGVNRWYSPYYDTLANKVDWYYDAWSNEDYVLHVASSGNTGSGSDDWGDCMNNGYVGWDTAKCEECMKYSHNIIAVGNLEDATNYNYSVFSESSWKNGPLGDEAPHVVANGESIYLPWGANYTGTSLSSGAITAMAASIVSTKRLLSTYPEMLKSIIMLSAVGNPSVDSQRWPWSQYTDKKAGTGLPSALYAKRMANQCTFASRDGDTINAESYGACAISFLTSESDGDSVSLIFNLDTAVTCSLHMLLTWMSNPDHANLGATIPVDDVDLYVYKNGNFVAGSYSYYHSTEYLVFEHTSGSHEYRVKIHLYNRRSTSNYPIWGAFSWAVTN